MTARSLRNILVPVDVSEASLNALDTAVSIARENESLLTLLHVDELHPWPAEGEISPFNNHLNAGDVLNALAGSIEHKTGLTVTVLQEEGNICDTIIKTAYLKQADLIVMGTHGASGFRDGFMGSNTYRVIKNASCAVLAIPGHKKYKLFRNILFPIRPVTGALSEYRMLRPLLSSRSFLNVLGLSNQAMLEAENRLLEKIVGEIKGELENDRVESRICWGDGDSIPEEIIHYTQQHLPDLVVMTSLVDVTTKPQFIGPYTQRIINTVKTPVLCIKKAGVVSYA